MTTYITRYLLEKFSSLFNRRYDQASFLFGLCGKDWGTYLEVELKIKNLHINYCPGSETDVRDILNMELTEGDVWFNIPDRATFNNDKT